MALELANAAIFLNGAPLVAPFSLTVAAGEIVTIMGPSGCGKSSLLTFIAGDIAPPLAATGRVLLEGEDVSAQPPERRRIGRLFQDDLLFPHMTVAENLMFGVPRGPHAERDAMVQTGLKRIDMEEMGHRPPHTLSGGQRARVALMRTLLAMPRAVLLDEPFNRFDADLRGRMRSYVFDHLTARAVPGLLVTHDIADAPAGGRILAIRNGEVRDA
jgi:putative thiamine transport system ATP-binding protein